jgi:hypothetical protein
MCFQLHFRCSWDLSPPPFLTFSLSLNVVHLGFAISFGSIQQSTFSTTFEYKIVPRLTIGNRSGFPGTGYFKFICLFLLYSAVVVVDGWVWVRVTFFDLSTCFDLVHAWLLCTYRDGENIWDSVRMNKHGNFHALGALKHYNGVAHSVWTVSGSRS